MDSFSTYQVGLGDPCNYAISVTPHDTEGLIHPSRMLFVGTGGSTLKVKTLGEHTVTFTNVIDGAIIPVRVTQVFDTGTDADDIIALF